MNRRRNHFHRYGPVQYIHFRNLPEKKTPCFARLFHVVKDFFIRFKTFLWGTKNDY